MDTTAKPSQDDVKQPERPKLRDIMGPGLINRLRMGRHRDHGGGRHRHVRGVGQSASSFRNSDRGGTLAGGRTYLEPGRMSWQSLKPASNLNSNLSCDKLAAELSGIARRSISILGRFRG